MIKRFSLLIISFVWLVSCGDKLEPQIPENIAVEKLAGTAGISYTMGSNGYVRRNQSDESVFYSSFSLRFIGSSKTYTSTGASDLFESSGTWDFVGGNFDKIKLSGGKPSSQVDISYTKNGEELILIFSVPTPSGGRILSLTGSYEIKLAGG